MVDEVSLIKKIKQVADILKRTKDPADRKKIIEILKQSFLNIQDQLSPKTKEVLTKSIESIIGEKLTPGPSPAPTPTKQVRYAIMSDAHANIQALDAVYTDIQSQGVDQICFLGDLVGYGGNPVECFNAMRGTIKPSIWIRGNHDAATITYHDGDFNIWGEIAIKWTQEVMGNVDKEFLSKMPSSATDSPLMFTHGCPGSEYENTNVYVGFGGGMEQPSYAFTKMPDKHICFIGHVHVPAVYVIDDNGRTDFDYEEDILDMNELNKVIINVGSVGQPRDNDPRACYVLLTALGDNKFKIEFRRVLYGIKGAQDAIIKYWDLFCNKNAKYKSYVGDRRLAERLLHGK
jgi:predicted phosphodiesterase